MLEIIGRQQYFVIEGTIVFDKWTLNEESFHPENMTIVTFCSRNRVFVDMKTVVP